MIRRGWSARVLLSLALLPPGGQWSAQAEESNFLDALRAAKVNLQASLLTLDQLGKQSPAANRSLKAVVESLSKAEDHFKKADDDWNIRPGSPPPTINDSHPASTLKEQMDAATTQLSAASGIAGKVRDKDITAELSAGRAALEQARRVAATEVFDSIDHAITDLGAPQNAQSKAAETLSEARVFLASARTSWTTNFQPADRPNTFQPSEGADAILAKDALAQVELAIDLVDLAPPQEGHLTADQLQKARTRLEGMVIAAPPPGRIAGFREALAHFSGWFNLAAVLLSTLAVAIVFMPTGPVARLRTSSIRMREQIGRGDDAHRSLEGSFTKLHEDYTRLEKAMKMKPHLSPTGDDSWDAEDVPQILSSAAKTTTPSEPVLQSRLEADRSQHPLDADDTPYDAPAAVFAEPLLPVTVRAARRDPLTDYNEARGVKAADRAEVFRSRYPSPLTLACVNPAARLNGPFTDLRFKEDEYGNFLALLEGTQAHVFPGLTYDYSTGRKTLEGVFEYPPGESAAFRLTRPALVERSDGEWLLRAQGAFENA